MSQKQANGNFKGGKGRGGGGPGGGGGGPPNTGGGKPFQQPRPQTSGPSFQPVSSQPSPPKPTHSNQPQPQPQPQPQQVPQQPPLSGQPIQQRQTPTSGLAQQTTPVHHTQPQNKQKPVQPAGVPQSSQPVQLPPAQPTQVPQQPNIGVAVGQSKGPPSQGTTPQQFQPQPNRKTQPLPAVQNGQGRQQQQGRLPSGQGPGHLQGLPTQQNPVPGMTQPVDSKPESIKGPGEGVNQMTATKVPRGPGETPVVGVVPKANAQLAQPRQGATTSSQGFSAFPPPFTPVTNPATGLPYPITYTGNLNQPNYTYHTQPTSPAAPQPTQPGASNRPPQIPKRFAPTGFSTFPDPSEKSEEPESQVSPSTPFVPPQRPLSAPPTPNYRDQQRSFHPYKTSPIDPSQYPYYTYYNNPVLPPTSPSHPIHQVHSQYPNQHPSSNQSHTPYNYGQPQYGPGNAHHIPHQNMHPTLPGHIPTSPNHSPHTTPTSNTSNASNQNQPNFIPAHSNVRPQIPVTGGQYVHHGGGISQMMPSHANYQGYPYPNNSYYTPVSFIPTNQPSKRLPIIDPNTQKEISVSPEKEPLTSTSAKTPAAVTKASPNVTRDVGFNVPSQQEKGKGSIVETEKKSVETIPNQEKANPTETSSKKVEPIATQASSPDTTKTADVNEIKDGSKESKPAERASETNTAAPATKDAEKIEVKVQSKDSDATRTESEAPKSLSKDIVSPKSQDAVASDEPSQDSQLSPTAKGGAETDAAGQAPKKLSKKQKKQEKRLKEQQQKEQLKESPEKELTPEVKEESKPEVTKEQASESIPAEEKKEQQPQSPPFLVPHPVEIPAITRLPIIDPSTGKEITISSLKASVENIKVASPKNNSVTEETPKPENNLENGNTKDSTSAPEVAVAQPATSPAVETKESTSDQAQTTELSPRKEDKPPRLSKDKEPKDVTQSQTEEDDDWERKEEADLVISAENAQLKSPSLPPQPIVYPDGVWTPDNPAGKKMYNKDFLLKFQGLCVVKPDGLPPMEVILGFDEKQDPKGAPGGTNPNWRNPNAALMPNAGRGLRNTPDIGLPLPTNFQMRGQMGMPGYPLMNMPPQFNPGGRNAILGGRGRGTFPMKGKPKQPPTPTGPPVSPLVPTKDRWVRPANAVESDKEKNIIILRKTQGLLNRLAPDNFDNIFNKILALGIDTVELLKGLIGQLFDKAVSEPSYSPMYAELCKKLAEKAPEFKDEGSTSKTQTFKRILLNKCQEEFEKKLPRPSENLSDEEKQEYEFKVRKRMLGNIKFIGELYKIKMLTERIMYECIERLLGDPKIIPPPEDIEALCQLFTTIGVMIDRPNTKMNLYFTALDNLRKNKALPNRLRFMIDNVIDLRANNWIPRKIVESPKETDAKESMKPIDPRGNYAVAPKKAAAPTPAPIKAAASQPVVSKDGWEQVPTRRDKKGEPVLGPGGKFTSGGAKGWGAQRDAPAENKTDLLKGSRFSTLQTDSGKGIDRNQRDRGERDRGERVDRSERGAERTDRREQETKAPKSSGLSFEQFDAKSEEILEEFFSSNEAKEAVDCIKELNSPNYHHEFIAKGILNAMEKKESDRIALAKLFHEFRSSGAMTEDQLIKGYQASVKDIEDFIIDVPTFPINIGNILGTGISNNDVSLSKLPEILSELVNTGRAESILPALFDVLFDQGLDVKKMYEEAKLDIQSFLKPSNRNADYLSKYLAKHDLGVLTGASAARTKVGKKVFEKQSPANAPSSDEENDADSE